MGDLERTVGKIGQGKERLALSAGAQQALFIAIQEEANIFEQPYIETPDVLIGLIAVEPTRIVLEEAGVTIEKIREARRAMGGYSGSVRGRMNAASKINAIETIGSNVPFRTHRMQKMGAFAEIRAKENGQDIIEPEDLLIVLIEENGSAAVCILEAIGVDKKKLLEKISGSIIES